MATETVKSGRGGKRVGAGRKAVDGAVIAGTLAVGVDAESLELLDSFEGDSYGVKLRALCKAYRDLTSPARRGTPKSDTSKSGASKAIVIPPWSKPEPKPRYTGPAWAKDSDFDNHEEKRTGRPLFAGRGK